MDLDGQTANARKLEGLNDCGLLMNDAGEASYSQVIHKDLPLPDGMLWSSKYFDAKATRVTCAHFGINLPAIEGTSITWLYLVKEARQDIGASIVDILDWSGSRPNWQRKIKKGIEEAVKDNMLERIPFNGGYRILVTTKGERVLNFYSSQFDIIKADIIAKRSINLLARETKRLKKEALKSLRQANKK